jgi:hypothetical protein
LEDPNPHSWELLDTDPFIRCSDVSVILKNNLNTF